MIFALALAVALAEPTPAPLPPQSEQAPAQPQSQISLAEAGRAIAAGRLDQAQAILGAAIAAGARGDPVDRLLADLYFARGDDSQRCLSTRICLLRTRRGAAA
jgi:hypothetical protein